ncbi:helix-turn-helix domain-containing protein [Mesobacillus foraminis]|uniref:helix-turn-helix domain-containing protein n=1 Tax=Mesobacillus foraminis TaxID=279826 RepID=UPI000EF51D08|nr:helix-turn-helix domain-containing protein [Mesobacillus foraminis]
MEITYTEAVILYCLKQLKGERTIFSLYHLYQGKKSSQTIQDAHLYHLTPFFHAFPFISREELARQIERMEKKSLLDKKSSEHFILTSTGDLKLGEYFQANTLPPKYLDGWRHHHLTALFWERLSILVQVCSNLVYQKKSFIPIQNKLETLDWVKAFIKKRQEGRMGLSSTLFFELLNCFQRDKTIDPSILVLRLTGHDRIGLTSGQAAELLGMDHTRYQLEFLNILHFLIGTVSDEAVEFPLLNALIPEAEKPVPFTLSTEKTYQLLNRGYTVEQISRIRNLKRSTIEDHIVEIALHIKNFDLAAYVPKDKEKRILEAAKETSAKKLKLIREYAEDASYFEIRLVLARNGDQQWN